MYGLMVAFVLFSWLLVTHVTRGSFRAGREGPPHARIGNKGTA